MPSSHWKQLPRPFSNSFISSSSLHFHFTTTAVHISYLSDLNIINSQTYVIVIVIVIVIVMHAVDVARTHEILARYRPIAPKPPVSDAQIPPISPSGEKLNVARAPARPSRTRKRGRGSCASSFASQKRTCRSTYVPVLPSPNLHRHHGLPLFRFSPATTATGTNNKTAHPVKAAAASSSAPAPAAAAAPPGRDQEEFLTLSLFPYSYKQDQQEKRQSDGDQHPVEKEQEDAASTTTTTPSNPTEKDLLGRLHKCSSKTVIVPQPVRPVGSSVMIGLMKEEAVDELTTSKTPSEVEDDAELDDWPVVVSDSHNRVRLANSAYKELVGQPECSWLDTMMVVNGGGGSGAVRKRRRRISGEVILELADGSTAFPLPVSCNRFSCKVKIEWTTCNGQKKLVSSPCDVTRLSCPSKDYAFSWRFRTHESN